VLFLPRCGRSPSSPPEKTLRIELRGLTDGSADSDDAAMLAEPTLAPSRLVPVEISLYQIKVGGREVGGPAEYWRRELRFGAYVDRQRSNERGRDCSGNRRRSRLWWSGTAGWCQ